jgi:hypothetical protein
MLIGFAVAGKITDAYKTSENVFDYKMIWLIPAAIAFVVLLIFALFFNGKEKKKITDAQAEKVLAATQLT